MKLKNPKYLPVLLFSDESFIIQNGKLKSMYCKMKDGNYTKSYYEKIGGLLQQEIITKDIYYNKKGEL